MAWTRKLPSGNYQAGYRDADGKHCSAGTFPSKKEALAVAVIAEQDAGRQKPKTEMTWGEWERRWTPTRKVQPSTASADKARIDKYLRPRWGDVMLADIETADVQEWIDSLKVAATTKQKIGHLLGKSLRDAADKLPGVQVLGKVHYPQADPSPQRWLTKSELAAIRDLMDEDHLLLFDFLTGTGCRWGEAVGTHWDQINLDDGTLTVRWSFDRSGIFKAPKTGKVRTVPLGGSLVSALRDRLAVTGWGSPPVAEYRGGNRPLHGLVFPSPTGKPQEPRRFGLALAAAAKAARVDGKRVGHVRVHDLRHSYASQLVQQGVPLDTVQKLLGHSSVLVTQRYADAGTSQWDAVRSVLG